MITETIDHTTLTKLAEAGAVSSAHVVGQDGGWGILVKYGNTERALAAQRSRQVRIFAKFETLVKYLTGLGIDHFDVDAANYDVSPRVARTRPDQSVKMKSAHEAAAYDSFFREKVQRAIDDPRPPLSSEDARQRMDISRAALARKLEEKS